VRAGKVAIGRNAFAPEVAYPVVFVPDEATRFAPAEVILGLSRQESEFNPRAYSSAGARGLMQLIPSTALATARKAGLRYSRSDLLDDPVYNMIIGSAHLAQLFDKFNGSRVMTFAAYNAGPNRIDEWIERYGDPRAPDIDPIDWVEQIPFAETRNYVQRVLENTQVYRARLNAAPIAGRLAADLERGGPERRAGALPNAPYAAALPPLPERTARFASATPSAPPAPVAATAPADEPAVAETGTSGGGGAAPANDGVSLGTEGLSDADNADFLGDARKGAPAQPRQKPAKPKAKRATPPTPISGVEAPPAAPASEPPSPVATDVASPPAAEPLLAPEIVEAPPADATADEFPLAAAPSSEACGAYRAYIAETAKEEASAADLNAGMLAEFASGACKSDSGASPPPTN
jgi:soluble lytic murein transglycosylase